VTLKTSVEISFGARIDFLGSKSLEIAISGHSNQISSANMAFKDRNEMCI
jgi:hypothetical protein